MATDGHDPWKSNRLDLVAADLSHGSISLLREPNRISTRRIIVSIGAAIYSDDNYIASYSHYPRDSCRTSCSDKHCEFPSCRTQVQFQPEYSQCRATQSSFRYMRTMRVARRE